MSFCRQAKNVKPQTPTRTRFWPLQENTAVISSKAVKSGLLGGWSLLEQFKRFFTVSETGPSSHRCGHLHPKQTLAMWLFGTLIDINELALELCRGISVPTAKRWNLKTFAMSAESGSCPGCWNPSFSLWRFLLCPLWIWYHWNQREREIKPKPVNTLVYKSGKQSFITTLWLETKRAKNSFFSSCLFVSGGRPARRITRAQLFACALYFEHNITTSGPEMQRTSQRRSLVLDAHPRRHNYLNHSCLGFYQTFSN